MPTVPGTREESVRGRLGSGHGSLFVPDRASSLKSSDARHMPNSTRTPEPAQTRTNLIHSYLVCGLNRSPTLWTKTSQPGHGKAQHLKGSIGIFLLPQVLGSIPGHEKDEESAQTLSAAIRACFPNDVEVCADARPPPCTSHTFVLQRHPDQSLYGVALRIWVNVDADRAVEMRRLFAGTRNSDPLSMGGPLWIPYCFSYLSPYPIFDLMNDYLRCTWMRWNKEPDTFNSEGVGRFMRLPAPKPNDFINIELGGFALCYHVPASSDNFQNFSLWPLFSCLSTPNIVAVLETALSPKGRLILTSQHPAILTTAAETIRFYAQSWAGLYVPVAYARHAQELIEEPAPYILGMTKQSRSLFTAPRDALLVDLDFDRIFTSAPPVSLTQRQRRKAVKLLEAALGGPVAITGVPTHLRSAYDPHLRFSAAGSLVTSEDSVVEVVRDPAWWNHENVVFAVNHISDKVRRNAKLMAMLSGSKRRAATQKVLTEDLVEILHERNQFARNVSEAWRDYITLKHRMDNQISDLSDQKGLLESELQKWKKEFAELSECADHLVQETVQLQAMVKKQKHENSHLSTQLRQKAQSETELSSRVSELEGQYKQAFKALHLQQELLEEVDSRREEDRKILKELQQSHQAAWSERDNAQRAVVHLSSLISGQISYIERVMSSLSFARPVTRPESVDGPSAVESGVASDGGSLSPAVRGAGLPNTARRSDRPSVTKRHTIDFSNQNSIVAVSDSRRSKRLSQLASSPPTDELHKERVAIIAQTIRKINEQCITAIEDLATKSDSPLQTGLLTLDDNDNSERNDESQADDASVHGSETERARVREITSSIGTPSLDSRAQTAQSGSIGGAESLHENDNRGSGHSPRIVEEDAASDAGTDAAHGRDSKRLEDSEDTEGKSSSGRLISDVTRSMIETNWGVRLGPPDT